MSNAQTSTRSGFGHPIECDEDVVRARNIVRTEAIGLGFTLIQQTKLITAVSEIVRNALTHAGGGVMHIDILPDPFPGIRVVVEDEGPGIADLELAFSDGFTTGGGLGLGLGGARRLSHEFEVVTSPGSGTRVSLTRYVKDK